MYAFIQFGTISILDLSTAYALTDLNCLKLAKLAILKPSWLYENYPCQNVFLSLNIETQCLSDALKKSAKNIGKKMKIALEKQTPRAENFDRFLRVFAKTEIS